MSPDVWAWSTAKFGCLQQQHPLGHSRTPGICHLHLRSRSWLKGIAEHALRIPVTGWECPFLHSSFTKTQLIDFFKKQNKEEKAMVWERRWLVPGVSSPLRFQLGPFSPLRLWLWGPIHAAPDSPTGLSLKQAERLQFDCGNQARSCQIIIWSDEPKEVCFFTLWFGQLEGSWMGLKTFSDLSAQTSVPLWPDHMTQAAHFKPCFPTHESGALPNLAQKRFVPRSD